MNNTLTKQMIESAPSESILFTGITTDGPAGLNMMGSGKELRYVIVRGGVEDWKVYVHFSDRPTDWIMRHGDKVHDRNNIENIVTFDDEVWSMYRH